MPKQTTSISLPHLTIEELADRDFEESRLGKQLSSCWNGDDFDLERAEHLMRAYSERIFDIVHAAYRKKSGYAPRWIPNIVVEAVYRALKVSQGYIRYGVPSGYLSGLGSMLQATVMAHVEELETIAKQQAQVEAAPMWPAIGQQASAYTAIGVDIENASLSLKKVIAVGPPDAPPQPPRNRLSSQITSATAAHKMEAFMEDKGLNQTEFAIRANTSDKTIRKFRHTGKVKRSILTGIASAMGITKEELLKP